MKLNFFKSVILLVLSMMTFSQSFAQGTSCATADPFCSNGLDPYPAGVNNPAAPLGNNYDCLFSQPNPAWFYISASQNGDLSFTLDNTNGVDIDFIVYGPFTDLVAAASQCGGLGNGGASGAIADCSYSGAAVEPVNIVGAQAGDVYILMVTNYSNQPTDIFATANAGTGDYACDCETTVWFDEAPAGFNDGVLVDTSEYFAEFVVCAGGQLGFTIDVQADSIVDSVGVYLPNTDIGDVFGAGNVTVFGPTYPISNQFDTASFVVLINTNNTHVGINDFTFSILNSNCVQDVSIRVIVPGIEVIANDTTICPGLADTIGLTAVAFADSSSVIIGQQSYQWTQIAGITAGLNSDTIQQPLIYIPSSIQFGDSIVYEVTYQVQIDTATCSYVDTLVIRADAATMSVVGDTSICAGGTAMIEADFFTNGVGSIGNCGTNPGPCGTASSQVTVGTNSTTTNFPFDGFWEDGKSQFIYRATELTMAGIQAGLITELAMNVAQKFSTQPYSGLTISIGCTNLTEFTPVFPPPSFVTGLTQVYTGSYSTVLGWNTFAFSTPYEWDGVSNLIIEICFDNTSWTDADDVQAETTTYNSTLEFSTDGVVGCAVVTPNQAGTNRPIMRFSNCGLAPPISYQWTPATNIIVGTATDDSIGVSPQIPTNYVVTGTDGYCTYTDTVFVDVQGALPAPIISCDSSNNNSISFGWGSISGAANYEYSLDGGNTWIATTDTFLTSSGLVQGDSATIYVRGIVSTGTCLIGSSANQTCFTTTCNFPGPLVSCDSSDLTSVSFSWTSLTAADQGYEYSIDGGATWVTTTDTFVIISGLANGTTINIQVQGISSNANCTPSLLGTAACSSLNCNNPQGNVLNSPNTLCIGSNAYVVVSGLSGGSLPFLVDLGNGQVDTAYAVGDTLFQGIAVGNYNASLTDLSNGCVSQGSVAVIITDNSDPVDIQLTETTSIACGNNTGAALTASTLSGTPTNYIWSDAQTTATASALAVGTYTVTATDVTGTCSDTASYTIAGPFTPTLDAFIGQTGQDSTCITVGESIDVDAGTNETGVIYSWAPATYLLDANAAATSLTADSAGTIVYTVTAISADSCIATDQVVLCVDGVSFLGMPTAFTPNGDGTNDSFGPVQLEGATVTRFEIYNRWGVKIYEDNVNYAWDGKVGDVSQPRDTYIYVLEYQFPADEEPTLLRGTVTLLR